jgi:hypothetical protein
MEIKGDVEKSGKWLYLLVHNEQKHKNLDRIANPCPV